MHRFAGKQNLATGICLGIALLSVLFGFYGYEHTWRLWKIPVMSPAFADIRTITHGAESYRQGYDPLFHNPADHSQREMNYPRIWQCLYIFGINKTHTIYLGLFIILLFVMAIYLCFPMMDNLTVAALMFGLFSPAVLLGVERGNIDLLMFSILSLAVFMARKYCLISTLLIWITFFLKLFPIFGLAVLLRLDRTKFIQMVGISLVIAALYIILTFDDLTQIYHATPKRTSISYGIGVIGEKIGYYWNIPGLFIIKLSYLSVFAAIPWMLFILRNSRYALNITRVGNNLDFFRVGSAIYIGTFLLGHNHDYRLVFLLFTIPQLMSWARHSTRHVSWISRTILLAIFMLLWDLMTGPTIAHVLRNWSSLFPERVH